VDFLVVVDFLAVEVKATHLVKAFVHQDGTCPGCLSLKRTFTRRVRQCQTDLWFVLHLILTFYIENDIVRPDVNVVSVMSYTDIDSVYER